jgi:DNA-binding MarR family transcriptional regulator
MPGLQTVFSVLIRFETELWNAVDARLRADCDLPLSRFAPMQVVTRHGGCRAHDIADGLSMTVGGNSKLVDRIEASGYCIRSPNPGDRRSSIIELTPAGKGVLARATAVFEDELCNQLGTAMIAAIEFSRPRPFATGVDPAWTRETNIARTPATPIRRTRSDDRHHARGRS